MCFRPSPPSRRLLSLARSPFSSPAPPVLSLVETRGAFALDASTTSAARAFAVALVLRPSRVALISASNLRAACTAHASRASVGLVRSGI